MTSTEKVDLEQHLTVANYEDAITATGYGKYHWLVLVICGWAMCSDAVEILSVSFLLPTASCDLGMDSAEKGILNSVVFIGMMVGGYVWGSMADTYGRRAILMWSLTVNGLFGLCSSFSQVYWMFCVFRFLSGVGVGGSIPVILSYFCEFQPKDRRGKMISLLATFWMAGNMIAAAFAWLIIPHPSFGYYSQNYIYNSWRIFVAFCTLPSLTSAVMFIFMPESPKFLLQHGREDEALVVLEKIHRSNGATTPYQIPGLNPNKTDYVSLDSLSVSANKSDAELAAASENKKGISGVFQSTRMLFDRQYLRTTLVMISINTTLAFGYYGLWLWFPEIFSRIEKHGGSACDSHVENVTANMTVNTVSNFTHCVVSTSNWIYLSGFLTGLSNLPGNIFTILFMDRIGGKPMLAVGMVGSGLSVFFIWLVSNKYQNLAIACLFGAVSTLGWNALDVLSVEVYPTHMRSTSIGFHTGLARIAAILGNLAFGLLVDVHCAIPMFLVAGFLVFGGLSAILLPTTKKIDIH